MAVKKEPDHREQLMVAARKHIKLALIYADDGAWGTAGKMLHESADLFIAEYKRLHALMNGGA